MIKSKNVKMLMHFQTSIALWHFSHPITNEYRDLYLKI